MIDSLLTVKIRGVMDKTDCDAIDKLNDQQIHVHHFVTKRTQVSNDGGKTVTTWLQCEKEHCKMWRKTTIETLRNTCECEEKDCFYDTCKVHNLSYVHNKRKYK